MNNADLMLGDDIPNLLDDLDAQLTHDEQELQNVLNNETVFRKKKQCNRVSGLNGNLMDTLRRCTWMIFQSVGQCWRDLKSYQSQE